MTKIASLLIETPSGAVNSHASSGEQQVEGKKAGVALAVREISGLVVGLEHFLDLN
ncbi:MAG: hypothetical protein KY468_01030 [Armatimonadetes bacterium]|nr:hypothetical protein [Armatimonadota bacterium]